MSKYSQYPYTESAVAPEEGVAVPSNETRVVPGALKWAPLLRGG